MEQGNIGSKKRLANLAGPVSLGVIIEESRKKQIIFYTSSRVTLLESALGYFFCLRDCEHIRIIFRIQPLS